jgi:hypothetical protein
MDKEGLRSICLRNLLAKRMRKEARKKDRAKARKAKADARRQKHRKRGRVIIDRLGQKWDSTIRDFLATLARSYWPGKSPYYVEKPESGVWTASLLVATCEHARTLEVFTVSIVHGTWRDGRMKSVRFSVSGAGWPIKSRCTSLGLMRALAKVAAKGPRIEEQCL